MRITIGNDLTLALLPISTANLNRKIHDGNFEEAVVEVLNVITVLNVIKS